MGVLYLCGESEIYISMMINEVYFCLIFEGKKIKTQRKKKKKKDPGNDCPPRGLLGQRGAAAAVGALQLVPLNFWDEVWGRFWFPEKQTPGYKHSAPFSHSGAPVAPKISSPSGLPPLLDSGFI